MMMFLQNCAHSKPGDSEYSSHFRTTVFAKHLNSSVSSDKTAFPLGTVVYSELE
jgi:hypothetical protein